MAFDVSDLLAEFGGLMGLLAGISVFSIVELVMFIFKCFQIVACKSKVKPEAVQRSRSAKNFLVNKEHLFYYLSQTFGELLKESNIHGMHYTNSKSLSLTEKVLWFITICVLTALCSILVFNSLKHLQSHSVIVAVDEHIWNVEDVRFLKTLFFGDL